MNAWWDGLSGLARAMYIGAAFFSILFVWQLLAALMGLADDASEIADVEGMDTATGSGSDAAGTIHAFQLLSLRSILTFLTLFTWGSALYLNRGERPGTAMGISILWGLAGMGCVAALLYWLPKMAHTGTQRIDSCVGGRATVYLDIPAGGTGQVRTLVSGISTHVDAVAPDGAALRSGMPVVITRQLDHKTVEVKAVKSQDEE